MNEHYLYYVAGLLDGEGTITLSRQRKTSFRAPVVSITNTSEEILSFLKENFGGSISSQKTYQEHHKQAWIWMLKYDPAIDFLEQISPYLIHKEKVYRANLILNEYKKVTKRNGKYSKEELKLKTSFEDRFFHPSAA